MADNTNIQWTTHSWNPWQGCTKVSPGCDLCYMHAAKKRYGQDPSVVVRSKDPTFWRPLKKGKTGWKSGDKIFVCSWSDFFHLAADNWRPVAWRIIRERPDLIFQILTKRPQFIAKRLPLDWGEGWPNVWLGVTIEDQPRADERIPILLQTKAAVHFVSYEPGLGPVDISQHLDRYARCSYCEWTGRNAELLPDDGPNPHPCGKDKCPECGEEGHISCCLLDPDDHSERGSEGVPRLDWVIIGSESGPKARPMKEEWVREVVSQCKEARVPVFYKQRIVDGKKVITPMLDGQRYIEFPRIIGRQNAS